MVPATSVPTVVTQTPQTMRLGLLALTTQERLGRPDQCRGTAEWLKDWLREAYMPPRTRPARLRSCQTGGLRFWFRPNELALLEP